MLMSLSGRQCTVWICVTILFVGVYMLRRDLKRILKIPHTEHVLHSNCERQEAHRCFMDHILPKFPERLDQNPVSEHSLENQTRRFDDIRKSISIILDSYLTQSEELAIQECALEWGNVLKVNSKRNRTIRYTHHRYLTNTSIVLDVGGNVGIDAEQIIQRFHPKYYIILEPLKPYFDRLIKKFADKQNVKVYNCGLAATDGFFSIKITGKDGDASSIFTGKHGKQTIRTISVIDLFRKIGLTNFDIDLMTINCEGCEYDTLESLIYSNMIRYVRNIQFGSHTTLEFLGDPVYRYCRIQELLKRTHNTTYQYKFIWESWKRIDQ